MQLPRLNFEQDFDFKIKQDKDTFFIYDLVPQGLFSSHARGVGAAALGALFSFYKGQKSLFAHHGTKNRTKRHHQEDRFARNGKN